MGCYKEHKVIYATYMLSGEAEEWLKFASQTLPSEEGVKAWDVFKHIANPIYISAKSFSGSDNFLSDVSSSLNLTWMDSSTTKVLVLKTYML